MSAAVACRFHVFFFLFFPLNDFTLFACLPENGVCMCMCVCVSDTLCHTVTLASFGFFRPAARRAVARRSELAPCQASGQCQAHWLVGEGKGGWVTWRLLTPTRGLDLSVGRMETRIRAESIRWVRGFSLAVCYIQGCVALATLLKLSF